MAGRNDGLDDLMHELSVKNTPKSSNQQKNAKVVEAVAPHDDWDWDESSDQQHEDNVANEEVRRIAEQLRDYIHDIADSGVRESVNKELSLLSFRKFLQYYQESDQLAEYTIKTELPRMNFSLIRHDSNIDNKQEIEDVFDETPFEDIWRMANQSIFADILVALQRRYLRADLSVSVVSTASSFTIDLDNNKLQSMSMFHVTVPSGGGKTRLELCSFVATVEVDLKAGVLKHRIGQPDLSFVFDEQLLEAAEAIYLYTHSEHHRPLIEVDLQQAREQLLAVRKHLTTAGEGLLEGVVGGLGRIVGAGQHQNRQGNSAGLSNNSDEILSLYRRDNETDPSRSDNHHDVNGSLRSRVALEPVSVGREIPVTSAAVDANNTLPARHDVPGNNDTSDEPTTSTPSRGGGLFGTWFKVAEKVANVGQVGVQFALAVGEEVAKAAAQQATVSETELDHQVGDAEFKFPRLTMEAQTSQDMNVARIIDAPGNGHMDNNPEQDEAGDDTHASNSELEAHENEIEEQEADLIASDEESEIAEEDAW